MVIGERLKQLREAKKLSQGQIEKSTGLLRCYISRVENGHTVPAIETLEKLARALSVPLYQLFVEGEVKSPGKHASIEGGRDVDLALRKFSLIWSKLDRKSKSLVTAFAKQLAA